MEIMGRQAICRPFSTLVKSTVQRNEQCSVHPFYMQRIALPCPCHLTRRPARRGKEVGKVCGGRRAATSIPARAGLCLQTAGFWRPRGPPGGSARPAASPRSSGRTNQEAAGRGRGRAGRGRLRRLRGPPARAAGLERAASELFGSPRVMERLTLPPGGAAAVDDYVEYRR